MGDEETYFATTADTDQEEVTLYLPEYTIDMKNMIQHVVEEHQWNVQLFFIEDTQPCFGCP